MESVSPNLHTLLLDSIDDTVIATDVEGNVIYWNRGAEELYGFPSEEAMGKAIYELTVPAPNDAQAREIMASLQSGKPWRGNFEVHRKDGTRFPVEVRNVPVLNENKELTAIIGLSRDISNEVEQSRQHEQLIAALEQANRAKDEFLALISHELRTPLTSILGFSELLTKYEDQMSRESLRESLFDIRDSARRMNRTVHDLLALSRLEMQPEVELEPVALVSVVNSVVAHHRDQYPERPVTLKIEDGVGRVMAKPGYLEHVFENLISNAEKYSPVSTLIDVSCRRDGARVVVDVLDRGAGIEPEQAARIFEPFFRAPSAESTFGAGLGLTVCKRLMDLQHGEIWFEARDGGGSRFSIALPAEDSS